MNNARQIFEALFNNASIGIVSINHAGEIVLINQFALKQFGYAEEELRGKKIEFLIPDRYMGKYTKHKDHYINETAYNRPIGLGMDLYAIRKDGTEFPVEVSLSSYDVDGKQHAIAFISDVSVRKESEQELIRLNGDLERKVAERTHSLSQTVEKLGAALEKEKELSELKSKFVSLASHEFRTPLSTVLSSVYLIEKYPETTEQPQRERHIQRIVSSVNTLTNILDDFLSAGKIEEGKIKTRPQDFDMPELVSSIVGEMQGLIKTGQKITYTHAGSASVHLDPSLTRHIITNLISNAIKFSPDNVAIQVKTEGRDKEFIFSVADCGIGISREDKEHLFERFFRGANAVNIQGTGLGLHIVGKYAELMNGTIKCESELDKGTRFIITFNQNHNDYENNSSD